MQLESLRRLCIRWAAAEPNGGGLREGEALPAGGQLGLCAPCSRVQPLDVSGGVSSVLAASLQ